MKKIYSQNFILKNYFVIASTLDPMPSWIPIDPSFFAHRNLIDSFLDQAKQKYFRSDTLIVCHKNDFEGSTLEGLSNHQIIDGEQRLFWHKYEIRTYETEEEYRWKVIL